MSPEPNKENAKSPPAANAALSTLPSDIALRRVVDATAAAEFCGLSVPTWRVMCRSGEGPKAIRLSANRIGWRLSDLIAWLDKREAA
jgi:predicted DNA-binding transcriptional regulator AlpA